MAAPICLQIVDFAQPVFNYSILYRHCYTLSNHEMKWAYSTAPETHMECILCVYYMECILYRQWRVQTSCPRRWTAGNQASESLSSLHWQQDSWVLWLRDRVNRRWSTPRIYTTRPTSPLNSRTTQLWCF